MCTAEKIVHELVAATVIKAKKRGATFCVVDVAIRSISRDNFKQICEYYKLKGFEVIHYSDDTNHTMEIGWKKTFWDNMKDFFRRQ